MCRMIAASGQFHPRAIRLALMRMASNDNPAHTHEKRPLGDAHRHEDGWGAAWPEGDSLHVRRSVHSCLEDPLIEDLDDLQADLLILHARRASRAGSVSLDNTHPFFIEYGGRTWAFCHNGVVNDTRGLRPLSGLAPAGKMDSELLFHHLLNHLDLNNIEHSVTASLDGIDDYTALHSMLVSADRVIATAKRHPKKSSPEYHALWRGEGPNLQVISSEPLEGIGCRSWKRIPEPSVEVLQRAPVAARAWD